MHFRIRFSSEISIKSRPVRKKAIRILQKNIKIHFEFHEIPVIIGGSWDIITLDISDTFFEKLSQIKDILSHISGIAHFMQVTSEDITLDVTNNDLFTLLGIQVLAAKKSLLENKTFAVRVKRTGTHSFSSMDLERFLGGFLLEHIDNTTVDLSRPQITIDLEIKDKKIYIVEEKILGVSGYPTGFQEKLLSLISGGFDSSVASYSMMKRGCQVDFLFFNLGGNAHRLGVEQVSYYLWKTFSLSHKYARFHCVPFEDVVHELVEKIDEKYRGIILKRLMLQVASKLSPEHYLGVKSKEIVS